MHDAHGGIASRPAAHTVDGLEDRHLGPGAPVVDDGVHLGVLIEVRSRQGRVVRHVDLVSGPGSLTPMVTDWIPPAEPPATVM